MSGVRLDGGAAAIEPIEFNQLFQWVIVGLIYGYTFSYTFFWGCPRFTPSSHALL